MSEETLNYLRCSGCRRYLSTSPVHSSNDGSRNVCEECYQHVTEDYSCNVLYELAVYDCLFPCHNASEGCTAVVPFNHAHISSCTYGLSFDCPVVEDCFKGTVAEVVEHVKTQHKDILFTGNEISFTIAKDLTGGSTSILISFIQPHRNSIVVGHDQPTSETIVMVHIQGRLFKTKIQSWFIDNKITLHVELVEFGHNVKFNENVTFNLKMEPNMYTMQKHEMRTLYAFDAVCFINCLHQPSERQDPKSIFENIFCNIALDIPVHTNILLDLQLD